MCRCMCMCICMYVCISIYVYIYIYMYAYNICTHAYTHMYICRCMYAYVCVYDRAAARLGTTSAVAQGVWRGLVSGGGPYAERQEPYLAMSVKPRHVSATVSRATFKDRAEHRRPQHLTSPTSPLPSRPSKTIFRPGKSLIESNPDTNNNIYIYIYMLYLIALMYTN